MGFAAIARVTQDKWVTCSARDEIFFGLNKGDELQIETTICSIVRRNNKPVFIDNIKLDKIYQAHPTYELYGFESYVSVPLYKQDGNFFGTLCAIDKKPAIVKTPEIMGMFTLFADLISFHLNAVEVMNETSLKLEEERRNSELREQFIANLGHDLRNPLATIRMSSEILLKFASEEVTQRQAVMIKATTFRMEELIGNILDFARSQIGEGIILNTKSDIHALEKSLSQIVAEVETMSPTQNINCHFNLHKNFKCDIDRIGQLFSNLLRNAVIYGGHTAVINVITNTLDEEFKLSIINNGKKISTPEMENLFQPFYRNGGGNGKQGLGLGLYIAMEIAKAHGGDLKVSSTEKETEFTFTMQIV